MSKLYVYFVDAEFVRHELVSDEDLYQAAAAAEAHTVAPDEEPPAKRQKTAASGSK